MSAAALPSLAQIERKLGLEGTFYDFVRIAWSHIDPHPFVDSWHIALICRVLERVFRRELRKVVINIPPTMSKSTLVCVLWPVWCWLRDPSRAFLGTSFDVALTRRDAGKALTLIQSDWFRERWSDRVAVPEGSGAGDYKNSAGGWRFSTSTGGKATGRHPDVRIIDDPTKPQTVSPLTLEEAEKYWRETLSTRQRDPATVCTVLIMQRLHTKDLAGVFEREGGWHFVVLPMRYKPASDDYTPHPEDPRTETGELLCPERMGAQDEAELRKNLGSRGAAAQLDQRPYPEGGAIFKSAWLRWYDPETMTTADPGGAVVKLPAVTRKLSSWDLAFKDEQTSDYVAGQVWGLAGSNLIGLDGIRERLDFVATIEAVLRMRQKWPDALATLIEDKANGPAVMSALRGKVSGIIAVEPQGGKVARANAASPVVEAGNVYLPRGRKWAEDLAESLSAFPVGEWDDDVDAFTQLVLHVQKKGIDYAAAMRSLKGRTLYG